MPSPFATPPHPVPADALTPFQIAIPDTALQTLQTLLTLSPIAPPNWENAATHAGRFGAPRDWLVAAAHHWQTWDWRAKERELNSVPHFKLAVSDDGGVGTTTVHFAALFSPRRDAVPLLLLHGWPGSFVEFLPILTKVQAQYADAPGDLPFHVVVPSLTGYGFSDPPPRDRDFSHVDQARVMARAMAALGFERYVVQGGDVGSAVATAMAARYAEAAALHLNMAMLGAPPKGLDPAKVEYSERELESMERAKKFWESESDYAKLHGHKPSTVGLAVGSSPIALLAWIGEKMLAWSDPASQPSLDQIVTNISIYWFTGCYPTSIWFYRNIVDRSRASGTIEEVKGKPVGFSMFPKEISTPPKAWRDAVGNFTWTRQHEKGGHFAALEQPDVLWKDIVDFVNESWKN